MKRIKVLYGASPNAFKSKGGGEVLLLKTKEYVKDFEFEIGVFDGSQNIEDYDIFHNFNIHRDCFENIRKAKEAGVKIVISPVYWPSLPQALFWDKAITDKLKLVAVEVINKIDLLGLSRVKKMLKMADVITPSSEAESTIMQNTFGIAKKKISIIHNGVEQRFAKAKPDMFQKKFGLEHDDFLLYVGRIEERKNVLSLVKAMKGLEKVLVIIGNAKEGSEDYYQKCKKEAGKNIVFIPGLEHESKMLESAYAACHAFALPTWYETPGLAALEAGLAGANIVVTREGCTKEYFSGFASYVNPRSVKDIKEKIEFEMNKQKSKGLSRHIDQEFLWENTAKQTREAYKQALCV